MGRGGLAEAVRGGLVETVRGGLVEAVHGGLVEEGQGEGAVAQVAVLGEAVVHGVLEEEDGVVDHGVDQDDDASSCCFDDSSVFSKWFVAKC